MSTSGLNTSPHIATSGVNTFGTTFDLILRPGLADDPRCADLLRRVIESVMVVFPKESETALQDSLVAAIQDVDGRFARLNLLKISSDPGNAAETGTDGGVLVRRRFAAATTIAPAGIQGSYTLQLPGFPDGNYQLSVEPAADPGPAFRRWIITKTPAAAVIGFLATNEIPLTITAARL